MVRGFGLKMGLYLDQEYLEKLAGLGRQSVQVFSQVSFCSIFVVVPLYVGCFFCCQNWLVDMWL